MMTTSIKNSSPRTTTSVNEYVATRRSQLKEKGFGLSQTYGKSMRPLIWGGEHCVVVAPLEGEPSQGDLLMFRQKVNGQEINIVHRLVGTRGKSGERVFVTRGDNCIATEAVRTEEIIGRIVEIHRVAGFRPWHVIPTKKIDLSGTPYRTYTRVWAAIWPLRRAYYLLRGHLNGVKIRLRGLISRG